MPCYLTLLFATFARTFSLYNRCAEVIRPIQASIKTDTAARAPGFTEHLLERISGRKQNRSQPWTGSSEEKKVMCSSYILRFSILSLLRLSSPVPGLVRVAQMANLQSVLPPCTASLLLSFLLPDLHCVASQPFSDPNSLSSETDLTKAKCSYCWEGKKKKKTTETEKEKWDFYLSLNRVQGF